MKRAILIILPVLAAVALALACAHKLPGRGEAFHSPFQPLDRGVLSTIPTGNRDFRRDPPVAESVTAQAMAGNDVRVEVRFAETGLPRVLNIQTEREPVPLRDDGKGADTVAGDNVFTAVAPMPPEFMEDRNAALARVLNGNREELVFRNRSLVPLRDVVGRIDRTTILSPFDFPPFSVVTNPSRSLFIIDPAVVNDPTRTGNPCVGGSNPNGPWSFKFLMDQMANQGATGISGSQLVENWLQQWLVNQPINGPSVPARTTMKTMVIDPWRTASGGGDLDLAKAPLQLIAIVNRLDLADNPGYGGTAAAGELRFVFSVLNGCTPTSFAVILEYGVPPKSCPALRGLAQAWKNLSTMIPGSPAYNAALQALTDPVVAAGAGGSKPNGSAINQIRTNEIALAAPWELREFRLFAGSPLLRQTTVKQTPIAAQNNTPNLALHINNNTPAILAGTHVVPLQSPAGTPFLAGNSPIPPFVWQAGGITNNNARHKFSLDTCSGCHGGETNTTFVHVNPATPIGTPAALSGFLTGIVVTDPVDGTSRTFDDLQRRANVLDAQASTPCFFIGVFHQTLRAVH